MIHNHLREGIKAEFPGVSSFSRKILCSIWHNETLIQAKNNPDQYTVAQIPSKMHLWVKCVKLGSSVYFKYIKQVFRYKRTLSLTFSQLYQPNENVLSQRIALSYLWCFAVAPEYTDSFTSFEEIFSVNFSNPWKKELQSPHSPLKNDLENYQLLVSVLPLPLQINDNVFYSGSY